MITKVQANNSNALIPPANCRLCGCNARVIKHTTFSYFFCDSCKDECEVWLKTESFLRGQRGKYDVQYPNDVVIDTPGVYRVEFLDGAFEWYEHKAGCDNIRLRGEVVQSSRRLTESDLPSRKPLQPTSKAGNGEKGEPPFLRTLSDAKHCAERIKAADAQTIHNIINDIIRLPGGVTIPCELAEALRDMGGGHLGIQQWKMPPDDEV